jgi:hypothetical protein
VSETSPETGGVTGSEPDPAAGEPASEPAAAPAVEPAGASSTAMPDEAPRPGSDASSPPTGLRPTRIELEVSRQRSVSWTIFGVILGVLLIRSLGTVGVWVGIALVVMGVYHAWQLLQTLRHEPGTISISDREIVLPRGLCMSRPVVVQPKDVTAIYFLRRSVPWNRSAPVLIIELGPRAMAFPRDWFASEADQRHVVHAVQRAKGQTPYRPSSDDDEA